MINYILNLFKTKKNKIEPNINNLNSLLNDSIYNIADEELANEVYFHLDYIVRESNSTNEVEYVLNLPEEFQNIYYIGYLIGEVQNGGFNQYYFNFSGNYAEFTPNAFKSILADKHYHLMMEANKCFEVENKKITEKQDGTLEGFSKSYEENPLEKFDKQIYALEKIENIKKLQAEYIRENKIIFSKM